MATSCHTHSLEPEGKNQRQLHGVFLVVAPIAWAVGQWLQAVPAPHDQLPGTGTRTLADTEPVRGREKPSSPGSPPPFRAQGGGAGSSVARLQLAHLHPCSKEKWE